MGVPTRESLESDPDYKRIEPKAVTASGSIWTSTFPAPKMCWDEKELKKLVGVELKEGDMYAVKEESWDYWYRATIKCTIDDKVEVFMVDNGDTLWIEKKNVRLLEDYSKKILPQIFQVNFHGIKPLIACFDGERKFTKVPTDRWSLGAVELIEKKIKASKATYFKEIETVNVGCFDNTKTVKFGIIYVDHMKEMVCLNDMLCAEGFATKVETFHVSDKKYNAPTAEESANESSTNIASTTTSSNRLTSDSESESTCRSDIEIETWNPERRMIKRSGNNMFSLCNIMIHSSPDIVEPIEPVSSLIESQVCLRIKSVLEGKRKYDLTPIQKHIYPILYKRHNIVVIGNTKSGKTLASVVAIVSLLRQEEFYSSLKKDYGPKAIHLCSYSYKVRNAFKMYVEVIKDKDVVPKMACGGTGVDEVKFDLLEGCDILVTTPACLLRILDAKVITNLNRLCHIVFDDADVIFDVFLDEIKILIGSIKCLEQLRMTHKVQKVVLSQTWLPKLQHFVKNVLSSGFICVSNFNQLEAAIYSSLKPHFSFLHPEHKAEYLINLLHTHSSPARVVVICNNKDEVFDLEKKLDSTGKRILIAHEGMTPIEVSYVKKSWRETMTVLNPVMICTDSKESILSELEITDCNWLIHFSIPSSKTIFSNRFGCLLDSFANIFLENEEKVQPRINIFVDETNDDQFPMIVSLMKRIKVNVDPTIERVVKRINRRKEMEKKHSPVCDQLREFGECYERKVCKFRHIFIKSVDDNEEASVPKTRCVKLRILNVHSVNHYSATIVEYKVGSKWNQMQNVGLLELISMKMDNYFNETSNRFIYPTPALGDMVAVEPEDDGVFCRGKVITILERDEKKNPKEVRVKLVDFGSIMQFKVMKLYELPDDLKQYEPQAIDVFLCKLKPADLDCAWDLDAAAFVRNWIYTKQQAIRNSNQKHNYLFGEINMSAGYTLWMDKITYCEFLEHSKTELHTSLGTELLQAKVALPNPDHMKIIRSLCAEAHLNVTIHEPKQEEEEECPVKENAHQWAHLPRDEFSSVEVILAENPDLMFIRHTKFKDRLDLLTKDLSKAKLLRLQEGGAVVGDICLAFFEDDGSWNRAKVMEVKSATEVKVFFVDHGDFKIVGWNHLAKISDTFSKRLLFQAMECRLAGVVAPNGQWSEFIDEAIYQLTEFEEMACKTLQAYVVDLELKAAVTGGRKYSIVLIDTNTNPFVVINEKLCSSGLAEIDPDHDERFEDILSQCKKIPGSDEESEEDFLNKPESYGFFDLNSYTDSNSNTHIKSNNDLNSEVDLENNRKVKKHSHLSNQQSWSDVRWDGDRVIPIAEPESVPGPSSSSSGSVPGPFQTILDNFEEYEDDLFSLFGVDKNQLLKNIFPGLEFVPVDRPEMKEIQSTSDVHGPKIREIQNTSDLDGPKIREIHNTSDVDGDVSDEEEKSSSKSKIRTKHKHKRRESEGEKKSDCDNDDDDDPPPPLVIARECYNPKVTWFDDREHVWVYIHLTNVQDYKVTWTYRSLSCRTINEGKYYSADFTLFGAIDPSRFEHSAKGFYVLIKMVKCLYGELWPRLMITKEQYYWIKRHVDHIAEDSDSNDDMASTKNEKMAKKYVAFNKEELIMDPKPSGFYSDSEFSSDPYDPRDTEIHGRRDDPDENMIQMIQTGLLHS